MIFRQVTETAIEQAAASIGARARFSFKPYHGVRAGWQGYKVGVASGVIRPTATCAWWRRSPWAHPSTGNHRRISAVCWHGHREFFRKLFKLCPDAIVTTALARYTAATFEATFPATGRKNIGSQMEPCAIQDACECREGAF